MNNRFQICGDLLQHKATSHCFSDDKDDFCDDDMLQERSEGASRGFLEAL